MLFRIVCCSLFALLTTQIRCQENHPTPNEPVRLAIVGLVHGHVHWLLEEGNQEGYYEIVGIAEPNTDLARQYQAQYGFAEDLLYADLEEMLAASQPEAVVTFTSTKEHLQVVEACAPKGIHVMVEKPLAATLVEAQKMAALAQKHSIHLITNYETTWYPSIHRAYRLVKEQQQLGEIRKMVAHHGHQGPVAIGVEKDFLNWLTDPVQNGGGALMDFGCYGANLMTWMMDGQMPETVTAVTQTYQLKHYPLVEDEATIILTYPDMQGIIQASWNWPYNRKDLEVYCDQGYVTSISPIDMRMFTDKHPTDRKVPAPKLRAPSDNPFRYFSAVVRGLITPEAYDLSALENNLIVMEILDAAQRSAATGQTVRLSFHKVRIDD